MENKGYFNVSLKNLNEKHSFVIGNITDPDIVGKIEEFVNTKFTKEQLMYFNKLIPDNSNEDKIKVISNHSYQFSVGEKNFIVDKFGEITKVNNE